MSDPAEGGCPDTGGYHCWEFMEQTDRDRTDGWYPNQCENCGMVTYIDADWRPIRRPTFPAELDRPFSGRSCDNSLR